MEFRTVTTEQRDEEERYLEATFTLPPELLEETHRSFALTLLHRRCATCWGGLVQDESNGMRIPAQEHLTKIAEHCSQEQDFIHPGLPVVEAVFRILLSNNDRPMKLREIHEVLQKRWSDAASHWTPLPEKLYRMLSKDAYYGIKEVSATTK